MKLYDPCSEFSLPKDFPHMNNLPDFKSIIPNFHRFRFRGHVHSGSDCFTKGKDYTIIEVECNTRICTIDNKGHKHTLSLCYFNQNCQLIDVDIEILELMDDLDDALINKDIKKFCHLSTRIIEELSAFLTIKEKDVEEGQYYEHSGQKVKVVKFEDEWCLIRQPKIPHTLLMLEHFNSKEKLVAKLNEKSYKRTA